MNKPSYEVSDFGTTKYGEKARKFTLNGAAAWFSRSATTAARS